MTTKRERYERANMRGGLGVRKRLSEESLRETYRLNGVQTGSVIARAHDKYFGDMTKGYDLGMIVRKTASVVQIHWLGDEDATTYQQGEARYEVDRQRWKVLGLLQGNPLDPNNPLVDALTSLRQSYRVLASASPDDPTPPTEENDMTKESRAAQERAAAQKMIASGDVKERETYTAKQVATRCGTDSKTMRKFFRSTASTVEPVGQGGRYEFAATDLPKIKREFDAWRAKAASRSTTRSTPKPTPEERSIAEDVVGEDEEGDFTTGDVEAALVAQREQEENASDPEVDWNTPPVEYGDQEPTAEDLAELEGELDLDDIED